MSFGAGLPVLIYSSATRQREGQVSVQAGTAYTGQRSHLEDAPRRDRRRLLELDRVAAAAAVCLGEVAHFLVRELDDDVREDVEHLALRVGAERAALLHDLRELDEAAQQPHSGAAQRGRGHPDVRQHDARWAAAQNRLAARGGLGRDVAKAPRGLDLEFRDAALEELYELGHGAGLHHDARLVHGRDEAQRERGVRVQLHGVGVRDVLVQNRDERRQRRDDRAPHAHVLRVALIEERGHPAREQVHERAHGLLPHLGLLVLDACRARPYTLARVSPRHPSIHPLPLPPSMLQQYAPSSSAWERCARFCSSSRREAASCAAAARGWLALRLRRVAYASSFLALRMESMVSWRLRRPVIMPRKPLPLTDLRAAAADEDAEEELDAIALARAGPHAGR